MPATDKKLVSDRVEIPKKGDIKIDQSRGDLEQLLRETERTINAIKAQTDQREATRRTLEDKAKKERANKIQNEVISSHKKNVEIDWNWQELEEKEDCKELDEEIKAQKAACTKIIAEKEVLIDEFQSSLNDKDQHYIKAMQTMTDDIEKLIKNMKFQYQKMREDYSSQLQLIEGEFDNERSEILERNAKEIENLFTEHRVLEKKYLDQRQQDEEENAKQLEDVMSADANKQNETKIKLETEMQILEKCMEDMKAIYTLNEEKLKFNYEVLFEREGVNKKMKKTLNNRKRRAKITLGEVTKQFRIQSSTFQKQNIELTNEYKQFTAWFKDLQKKYERFEKSDDNRIKEVWSMNDQEARNLVEKIMQADKVIHLQQLSIGWKPPSDPFFSFLSESNAQAGDSSYKGADSATQGNSVMNQNTSIMDSQNNEKQAQSKSELVDDQSIATGNAHDIRDKYEKIKNVFKILIAECSYLIDDKAFEKCEGRSLKEQFSIKIDSIRKSLGIEAMQDVELLVDTLYEYQAHHKKLEAAQQAVWDEQDADDSGMPDQDGAAKRPDANGDAEKRDGEESEEKDPNELDLDLTLLVKALKKFHKDREDKELEKGMLNVGKAKKKEKFADKAADAEREKKKNKFYWERMTTILTDQKRSVWGALDKALAKYYQMLVDRQNLIEETGLLNQQNEELKTLLNQYLQAGVNQELQVPPTQVIRLDI